MKIIINYIGVLNKESLYLSPVGNKNKKRRGGAKAP